MQAREDLLLGNQRPGLPRKPPWGRLRMQSWFVWRRPGVVGARWKTLLFMTLGGVGSGPARAFLGMKTDFSG